jgi:phosphoribosyl-ATP pyrophosphohydrolase
MGSGEQIIAIVPKNVVFRTGYSGRLYGAPAGHYYIFDGKQLLAVTWGERMATDILPPPYPRPEPVNAVSIADVLALAAKLPSGLPDANAIQKLAHERGELQVALDEGDRSGTLTEVADVAYYAIKAIHEAASAAGLTVEQALVVCEAKYRLRARPGNPKDDEAERAAVLAAFGE